MEVALSQPVQYEESLSQYAQHIEDASDAEEIADSDCDGKRSAMTLSINYPTYQQMQDNKVAIAKGGGAYNNMLPLFQQMTNLADTDPYIYEIMWQTLNEGSALMNSETIRRARSVADGNILTHPNVDRGTKCRRGDGVATPFLVCDA
mmetsp:Transcript_88207/g.172545  ORF Transcript_88207/g.172545 Transcript_88207/m.172545 type:complete len:148 (+) Transcript_88207:629-1072(+)